MTMQAEPARRRPLTSMAHSCEIGASPVNRLTDAAQLFVPVQSGQTQRAVQMLAQLNDEWASAHGEAAKAAGLSRSSWYLAVLPGGAYVLAHMEGVDADQAAARIIAADEPFARWLRHRLSQVSGFCIDARSIQRLTHAPLAHVAREALPPDRS